MLGAGVGNRLEPYEAAGAATPSAAAAQTIERASGLELDAGVLALVRAPTGVYTPAGVARVRRVERAIAADPEVGRVRSFLDGGDARALVSRDARMTYLAVWLRQGSAKHHQQAAKGLSARLRHTPGLTLGGTDLAFVWGGETVQRDLRRAQLIALPILLLLLLVFFRGLVAGLLPLALGGLSILLTELALRVASGVTAISVFTLSLVSALGLGLAIDYSLLIVSRYREELAATPGDPPAALHRTMASAGRTVCFSAGTVAATLAALIVFPQPYFFSMGLGGAVVVLLTCVAAILVLPAMLALLGHRVNALAPAWLQASATHNTPKSAQEGRWYRLAQFVMRRPVPVALAAAAALIVLASPVLGITLTSSNASTLPRTAGPRQVSDALRRDFPADPSQNVLILATGAHGQALGRYRAQLQRLPGVASLAPPVRLSRRLELLELTPATRALSAASQRLVGRIQALRAPFPVALTGQTASFVDLEQSLAANLPFGAALVVAVTMIALFLMTGSAILPLKTLIMNALTVGAAYGIIVLVFQHGHLRGVLGYEDPGAIDITQPVVMLAVVLGLSTDYGVFVLDRIRELHRAGLPNQQAIALGLERTGRIITAAALMLCVAIGSIVTSQAVEVKEVSFGIAAAILIDATIVRSLLVPALMRLLGDLNWWRPGWCGRRARALR
ncbi:MAG TPA: MMPL family transporter [Solirubrobacteraceae bacterium]|nr:MMPL family transporter [Solirubrobacteraceae bacterium]